MRLQDDHLSGARAPQVRRFRFYPLCVAVVLERAYQVHLAAYGGRQSNDRADWYYVGLQGRRALEIAGLA